MATTQRPRTASPQSDPATRGLILVIVAVVIGLALLVKGVATASDESSTAAANNTTVVTAPSTAVTQPTVPTPATSVPPAGLLIAVANSSGKSGLARDAQTALASKGYTQAAAVTGKTRTDASAVYAAPGFEADAKAVATLLTLQAPAIQPIPADRASIVKDPVPTAQVVILLGKDATSLPIFAGGTATTAPPRPAATGSTGAGATGAAGATTTTAPA